MMINGGRNSRCPFTETQWEELENQALIYKYMVSGVPIPPQLILNFRRSLALASPLSSSSSSLFLHQSLGFQVGVERRQDKEEAERCRRTDGKKWRCSKEAHPGSKYCEKHMQRGKNKAKRTERSVNYSGQTTAAAAITSFSVTPSTVFASPDKLQECAWSEGSSWREETVQRNTRKSMSSSECPNRVVEGDDEPSKSFHYFFGEWPSKCSAHPSHHFHSDD